MLEIKVIENPKSDKESNRYLMVATLQQDGKIDQEDESEEDISVKAFRQRKDSRDETSERKAPRWTSKEASRRAKESVEKLKGQAQNEQTEVSIKAVRNSVSQAALKRPLKEESEESSYS